MLHDILTDMIRRGHHAQVICGQPGAQSIDEVTLHSKHTDKIFELYKWADVIITHLDFTPIAINFAKLSKKPVVHLIHNDRQAPVNGLTKKNAALCVANSQWIHDTLRHDLNKIIVYPPIRARKYCVESTRETITLINLSIAKGADVFYELARRNPTKQFLGVVGGYGKQVILNLPNVEIVPHTHDIQSIYARSKIVLMPSTYESWGRVAMEAGASGIPILARPTPGLKESLGNAGIFCESVDDFNKSLNALWHDKVDYQKACDRIKARVGVVELLNLTQLDILENELRKLGQ